MIPFIALPAPDCFGRWLLLQNAEALAGIDLVAQRPPPPFVVEIPPHRLLNAGVEGFERLPAKLALELRRVDGVAQIVPRAVRDELDERFVRTLHRPQFVEDGADALDDVNVAPLVAPADVVFLADPPALHYEVESARVVLDIAPVANVGPLPIDRQLLPVDGVENDERDELLGEMIGPVVVGAVRDDRREAIGARPGGDEVVGRRLGGGIGRAWI